MNETIISIQLCDRKNVVSPVALLIHGFDNTCHLYLAHGILGYFPLFQETRSMDSPFLAQGSLTGRRTNPSAITKISSCLFDQNDQKQHKNIEKLLS